MELLHQVPVQSFKISTAKHNIYNSLISRPLQKQLINPQT